MRTVLVAGGIALALVAACGPSESHVKEEIAQANHCTAPADCVNLGSHCPFGCYVLVNQSEADRIADLIQEYDDAHSRSQCMYDCIAFTGIGCREHQCVTLDATQ
jgi:hypothetical protein